MDLETTVSPAPETQIPAPVLAETPEVAAPETANQDAPPEDPKPEEDPRDRTVKNLQRRVDRVTAARYQEQARAQQAAQEAEQLRQRLSQYEQQDPQELAPEKVLPMAQELAQQLREQEKVRDSVSSVMAKGKELQGFNEACNAVNEELPFYDRTGRPSQFLRVVLECDAPEKVLQHLGNNPDLVADLAPLTPTQAARKLARLEAELAAPKEPKQSLAPKPLTPVKPVARDDGGLRDELSTSEWIARRNKQVRG